MQQRDDYGTKAHEWFESLGDEVSPLAAELRTLILATVTDAMEVIKWGTPVYEKAGLVICSLRAASQHVALQFGSIGTRLHDPGTSSRTSLRVPSRRFSSPPCRTSNLLPGSLWDA